MKFTRFAVLAMILLVPLVSDCRKAPQEVERPERIVSLREVMYDSTTYAKAAQLWEKYNDAYPSEDAYANWMYAARYAGAGDYASLLAGGLEKYPANPVLLYLTGLEKSGAHNSLEGRQLIERAAALDPDYMEAWYSLAVEYIVRGDRENADVALRHLLTGRAVQDVVMDFSYNMLASLDTNAILITNGDNDTFPGWILTRIIRFRPDVNIVNCSLLNLQAYAEEVVKEGVPEFITRAGMDSLQAKSAVDRDRYNKGLLPLNEIMNLGDRLVLRIVDAGVRTGRPVYLACTLNNLGQWEQRLTRAQSLGIVFLVTPSAIPYPLRARKLLTTWIGEYRAGGLDSWQLRASGQAAAGRMLARNYGSALRRLMPQIESAGPDVRLALFRWYRTHLVDAIPDAAREELNLMWCSPGSPQEIRDWCKSHGMAK